MLLFGNFDIWLLLAIGIVLFFGMGWHEYAHALVATWWGDPTPREYGRLTPNPLVHINWIGWAMFLLIGFGILGSVPVDHRRMRDGRWGMFWTSAAGPLANLIMAAISALILRLFGDMTTVALILSGIVNVGGVNGVIPDFFSLLLYISVFYNVLLFVFNLLPFFPIDGWRMVLSLLPGSMLTNQQIPQFIRRDVRPLANFLREPAYTWQLWAQASQFVLLGLIMLSFIPGLPSILGFMIAQPTSQITGFLLGG